MRALTKEEFKNIVLEEYHDLLGLTDDEVDIYYRYFILIQNASYNLLSQFVDLMNHPIKYNKINNLLV